MGRGLFRVGDWAVKRWNFSWAVLALWDPVLVRKAWGVVVVVVVVEAGKAWF